MAIDHTTVYRWVEHYAPELKKRLDWDKKRYANRWHLDETYIKIKGEWKYLRSDPDPGKKLSNAQIVGVFLALFQ